MVRIKDFPIIFTFYCEKVIKEKGYYELTLKDWQRRHINLGRFRIIAQNKRVLIHLILIFFTNNPNYHEDDRELAGSKITKIEKVSKKNE